MLPSALVFNWEAITFSCGNDLHNKQKVYLNAIRNADDNKDPPAVVSGSLGMYIKQYFFHN